MNTALADESKQKARDYLATRGTQVTAEVVHGRVAAAFAALDDVLAGVSPAQASRVTIPGEWTIQEIVDHLVETYRPGVDELRCVLAGQHPPGEPIPASLQSKAPRLRPWPWLLAELHRFNADVLGLLAAVPPDFETTARVPIVMVVNVPRPGGGFDPLHWVEDMDWKAYVIASWRLHPMDHLNQARKVLR